MIRGRKIRSNKGNKRRTYRTKRTHYHRSKVSNGFRKLSRRKIRFNKGKKSVYRIRKIKVGGGGKWVDGVWVAGTNQISYGTPDNPKHESTAKSVSKSKSGNPKPESAASKSKSGESDVSTETNPTNKGKTTA